MSTVRRALSLSLLVALSLGNAPSMADDKDQKSTSEQKRLQQQQRQAEKEQKKATEDRDKVRARTRAECRDEAKQRDFDVVDQGEVSVNGADGRMSMRLKRKGESFSADCRFDGGNKRASLSVRDGGGNGNGKDGGGSTGRAGDGQVKDKCVEAGSARGWVPGNHEKPTYRGNSVSEMLIFFTQREGGVGRFRCIYDNRDHSVTLENYKG